MCVHIPAHVYESGGFGKRQQVGRWVVGGLGFVPVLLQAASVLCCFVSMIKSTARVPHLSPILIRLHFWGLINIVESQGTFLGDLASRACSRIHCV